jgi:hypothetical protein
MRILRTVQRKYLSASDLLRFVHDREKTGFHTLYVPPYLVRNPEYGKFVGFKPIGDIAELYRQPNSNVPILTDRSQYVLGMSPDDFPHCFERVYIPPSIKYTYRTQRRIKALAYTRAKAYKTIPPKSEAISNWAGGGVTLGTAAAYLISGSLDLISSIGATYVSGAAANWVTGLPGRIVENTRDIETRTLNVLDRFLLPAAIKRRRRHYNQWLH